MKYIFTLIFTSFFVFTGFSQTNTCACCSEKHAEFDFWIGTWDVTNANGAKAGTNIIKKVQDKCVLQENWTSASPGYTGTSNNFYNLKTKQWEQLWVDNKGTHLKLKGNKIGNQMIMRTDDEINKDGKTFYHRITWTANKDGSVRQLWETITDKTEITVAFDGLYKKRD